jgi:hypothetical protein
MSLCDFYWGSHGCRLDFGHEGHVHECGTPDYEDDPYCSEFRVTGPPTLTGFKGSLLWPGEARYHLGDEWGEWMGHPGAFK